MKITASVVCILALTASSGSLLANAGCAFDQAYLARSLEDLAARNPGGLVNLGSNEVSWRLPNGQVVSVGHGGCVDLGTTVKLTFPGNAEPTTKEAVRLLLAAVSRYWSRQDSQNIASILANRKFKAHINAGGVVEIEADQDPDSPFFFGFTITLSGKEAAVSWQEA